MVKTVIRSECDDPDQSVPDGQRIWYTLVHDVVRSQELAHKNPWIGSESIIESTLYLLDDCVILIRPARSVSKVGSRECDRGYYFLELSNQDGSIVVSSRKIYMWEQVMAMAELFIGLSFQAATRVWGVKKY